MQRVLLTGSRGFVGSRVAVALAHAGKRVVPFEGDLRRAEEPVADIDAVIHAAALITHRGAVDDDAYREVNVEGTRRLLAAYPRQHIVYVSTTDVLRSELGPYARSKRAAEELVQARPSHCIVRLVSVFGPGQRQSSKLIPKLLRQHFLGEAPFPIGDDVRPYVYVDDAAVAIVGALDGQGIVEVSGTPIANADLVRLVRALRDEVPADEISPEHRDLYRQLRPCAEALVRGAAA